MRVRTGDGAGSGTDHVHAQTMRGPCASAGSRMTMSMHGGRLKGKQAGGWVGWRRVLSVLRVPSVLAARAAYAARAADAARAARTARACLLAGWLARSLVRVYACTNARAARCEPETTMNRSSVTH